MLPILMITVFGLTTAWFIDVQRKEPQAQSRFATLDGLRGVLAFCVFIHHAFLWVSYAKSGVWANPKSHIYTHLGEASVCMFFMLTAFLFWGKVLDTRAIGIDWKSFFAHRIRRLVPLYLVALTCLITLSFYIKPRFQLKQPIEEFMTVLGYWLAFTIPGFRPINGFSELSPLIGVVWSLAYEWLFYIALPLLSVAAGHRPSKLVLCLALVMFGLCFFVFEEFKIIMLAAFAVGMVSSWLVRKELFKSHLVSSWSSLCAVAIITLAVLLYPSAYEITPILMLGVAFHIVASGNTFGGLLLKPPIRYLGDMGYSIYLLHCIVLYFVFRFVLGQNLTSLTQDQLWLVVYALTPVLVVICALTYRFIEKPFMRVRN